MLDYAHRSIKGLDKPYLRGYDGSDEGWPVKRNVLKDFCQYLRPKEKPWNIFDEEDIAHAVSTQMHSYKTPNERAISITSRVFWLFAHKVYHKRKYGDPSLNDIWCSLSRKDGIKFGQAIIKTYWPRS